MSYSSKTHPLSTVSPKSGRALTRAKTAFVLLAGLGTSIGLTACSSFSGEEGFLPETMRSASATLEAKGYPDLTKIPDLPTNLPTKAAWSSMQSSLSNAGARVQSNPGAATLSADEANLAWAQEERMRLEASPKAAVGPLPGEKDEDWATAARAKLEADIANLPPT